MSNVSEDIKVTKQDRDFYSGVLVAIATMTAQAQNGRARYSKIKFDAEIENIMSCTCNSCWKCEINRGYQKVHCINVIKHMSMHTPLPNTAPVEAPDKDMSDDRVDIE